MILKIDVDVSFLEKNSCCPYHNNMYQSIAKGAVLSFSNQLRNTVCYELTQYCIYEIIKVYIVRISLINKIRNLINSIRRSIQTFIGISSSGKFPDYSTHSRTFLKWTSLHQAFSSFNFSKFCSTYNYIDI